MSKRRSISTSELLRRQGRILVGPSRPRLELEKELEEMEEWMLPKLGNIRKSLEFD